MDHKIQDIFDNFLCEQECAYERLGSRMDLIKPDTVPPNRRFIDNLMACCPPTNASPSDDAKRIMESFPDLPDLKSIPVSSDRTNAGIKYIADNASLFADLYISLYRQDDTPLGGINVNPDTVSDLFTPLGYGKDNENSFKSATKLVTDTVLEKAIGQVPEHNKTFCFLTGNPGAGKEQVLSDREMRDKTEIDKCAIVFDAPLASDSWQHTVDKLLEKNFSIRYVQIYNNAETSFMNSMERGIRTDRWINVNHFLRSYKSLQDRPMLINRLYGDRVKFIGIDNDGNVTKHDTLDCNAANKAFTYDISPEFFTNTLSYADKRSKELEGSAIPQHSVPGSACRDKLASIKQELLFARDILSIQSEQLPALAGTDTEPVRGEIQAIPRGGRDHLLKAEERLVNTVDLSDNPYIHENGEFTLIERVYDKAAYQFTGDSVISSSDDVANLFSDLETAAVENTFAVLIPKDDTNAVIQYVTTGTFDNTFVVPGAILNSALKVNAERVYFVHNHPSGELIPSIPDRNSWAVMNRALGMFDIKLEDGIIINTKSGRYATFNETDDSVHTRSGLFKDRRKYNIYEFSKLNFSKEYKAEKLFQIKNAFSVAQFISTQRLGERNKMGYLLLNSANKVVGNFFLPNDSVNHDNVEDISKTITRNSLRFGGNRVIVYGRFNKEKGCSMQNSLMKCSGNEIKVLDIVNQIDPTRGTFISYASEDLLLESKPEYEVAKNDNTSKNVKREEEKKNRRKSKGMRP